MKDITGSRADKNLPKWNEDGRDPFRLNGYLDKARLLFGEFSVDTKQYRDEPFTISWGDGTTSQVTFDLYTTSNGKGQEPTVHQAIRVTGGAGAGSKSDSSLIFTIVK